MQELKRKRRKPKGENMDIKKRYMEGELSPDTPKKPNEPMEFSGGYTGPKLGPDVEGKAKKANNKVDPAIFRMAEERDY